MVRNAHSTIFKKRCRSVLHKPAAAEAGRVPVLDDGGPRDPGLDCGELLPRTGGTGLSWPPEGLRSRGYGRRTYTNNQNK